MAFVQSIHTFPLKSGARIAHADEPVLATRRGLKNDRLWMLVWAEGNVKPLHHFTQRESAPQMAMVHTQLKGRYGRDDAEGERDAVFKIPGRKDLELENPNWNSRVRSKMIFVHGKPVQALDAGDQAADVFSDFVGQSVRLMRFDEFSKRPLDATYYASEDCAAFADGGPILVANTASFKSLSQYFNGVNVKITDFRPNIVIEGLEAWQEDVIYTLRIGDDVILNLVKPCTRCEIPSISQDTGIPQDGEKAWRQPTVALRDLRKGKADGLAGTFFGQNAVVEREGFIAAGMKVTILETRAMHPALQLAKLRYGIA